MRWISVCMAMVACIGPVAAQQMPQVDAYYDTGSVILADRMEVAEEAVDDAEAACGRSEYAFCNVCLTDAEFELQRAIEFGLPTDHPSAVWVREKIAKIRADMEEWGGDENAQQEAEAWWKRIYEDHARDLAYQVENWIAWDAMLTAEEAYWIPLYFDRVMIPEVEAFKEKYPDEAAFVEIVPDAGEECNKGENPEMSRYQWVSAVIPQGKENLGPHLADSLSELQNSARQWVMQWEGEGYPTDPINALDVARVILTVRPENETVQKIHDKAMEQLHAWWDEHKFKIEEMAMAEDVMPEDTEIHAAMQAAYESEAAEQGWNDQVLRVVVTSPFAESWEAWWVGDTLHANYFKRITGAVAVKQTEGCAVMRCLFRQARQDDGTFGTMYLGKVIDSYPILEENVNPQ